MIAYRNIHKSYDLPVLTGVDLPVETGEMFALLRPSGAGTRRRITCSSAIHGADHSPRPPIALRFHREGP